MLFTAALLVATVGAEDVFAVCHESFVGQTEGASFTVKAVFVPRAALKSDDIYAFTKSCDGVVAGSALLGHVALVTVHTEDLVLVIGEAGPGQRFGAGRAHEAVTVPRLFLVCHPPRGDRLFAAEALLGKLFVIAGAAENVVALRDEALCPNRPLTVGAGEAVLMPGVSLVLHTLCAGQDGFVAAVAARGILSGAALPAQDPVVFGAEWLFGQRFVAFCTTETLLMPVPVLMGQFFGLHRDGPVTLVAGVGTELCVTANTDRAPLISDKLLAPEVLSAVETVSAAVRHVHPLTGFGVM